MNIRVEIRMLTMTKFLIKPMKNINMIIIKYTDKTSFWEAFGVLLAAFSVALGSFWGPLGCRRGSLGDPWEALGASWGHIWDQVLKEDLPNFRKSGAGVPKRWPGEPRWPRNEGQETSK